MKYIIGLLLLTIGFSCTALKKNTEENNEVEVVDATVMEEEETTVLDQVEESFVGLGDCSQEWSKKERQILTRDTDRIKIMSDAANGLIYVIAKVNREGLVYDTEIQKFKTTVKDKLILGMALDIVNGYEFEPSDTAPNVDCGLIRFNLTTS